MSKRKTKYAIAAVAAAALTVSALDTRLTVRRYTLHSDRLSGMVRIALITDLHSCQYGQQQEKLCRALRDQAPDLVLLGGDIFDDHRPPQPVLDLLQCAAQYPCYYVTGNHEFWTGRVPEIKAYLAGMRIKVLAGDCVPVQVRGQTLNLCGVDDPSGGESAFCRQLEATQTGQEPDAYTILLAHRPERTGQYLTRHFDLILSGHTHGGQWRIPGLLNGFFAPNQGFLPAHAGGLYHCGDAALLVSRGLARESTLVPRIWNRPELVVVDLEPVIRP